MPANTLGPYALEGVVLETPGAVLHAATRVDGQLPGALLLKLYKNAVPGLFEGLHARAAGMLRLGSPNLVPVLDVIAIDGRVALVRPRVRAYTVSELVERLVKGRRTMPAPVGVRIVHDLLAGLGALHADRHPTAGDGWLVHGEVAPEHVLVDDTGRVQLMGAETMRALGTRPLLAKHDLAGALALLYELMPQRRTGAEGVNTLAASIPPEFAALLTEAMGFRATRLVNAQAVRDALLEASRSGRFTVATTDEVGQFVRRLTEGAPPKAFLVAPPQDASSLPLAHGTPVDTPAGGPESEPLLGMFGAPRPVSGLIHVPSGVRANTPAPTAAAPVAAAIPPPVLTPAPRGVPKAPAQAPAAPALSRAPTPAPMAQPIPVAIAPLPAESAEAAPPERTEPNAKPPPYLPERTEPNAKVRAIIDEPAPHAPAPLPAANRWFGKTDGPVVLLADPDAAFAGALATRLADENIRVLVVADGMEGQAALVRDRPVIIVSELELPRMDGLSLLQAVRSWDATREAPFFMVSARNDEAQSAKAMEWGADDFLAKPLNTELLVGKIKRSLARYAAMLQSQQHAEEQRRRAELAAVAAAAAVVPDASQPDPPPARPEPTGVIGTLKQMSVVEIIQSLEMGRKTAVVHLMFPARGEGALWIVEGEVMHAELVEKVEEEAFYEMARFKEGYFRIHYGDPPDATPRIHVSTTFMILEAMRRIDEERGPG